MSECAGVLWTRQGAEGKQGDGRGGERPPGPLPPSLLFAGEVAAGPPWKPYLSPEEAVSSFWLRGWILPKSTGEDASESSSLEASRGGMQTSGTVPPAITVPLPVLSTGSKSRQPAPQESAFSASRRSAVPAV